MNADEIRALRRRHGDLQALADRDRGADPEGDATLLVQTVTVTTYPAVARQVYGVRRVVPVFDEREGAAVTLTPVGPVFYAGNVGTAVPPAGTYRLATAKNSRWLFSFTG